jgi:hypothetical protein
MNAVTQAPQSIGQVLDSGFRLYRASFVKVVVLSLAGAFVGVVPTLIQLLLSTKGFAALLTFVLSIAAWLLRFTFYGAVIHQLDDVYSERNTASFASSLSVGLSRMLPTTGAALLYGLACVIGLLLLVIPGIWVIASLGLFMNAVILDRLGAVDSLQASQRLVSGNWWRVTTILTVTAILIAAIYFGITAIAALILPVGNMFTAMSQGIGPATLAFVIFFLVISLISAVLMPLVYSVNLVIYRDLQLRKSGGDLAARIADAA